jgi:hypothetical protein
MMNFPISGKIIQMFQDTNQREREIYIYTPLYYGEKDPLGSLELRFQVVGSLHEMGMLVLGLQTMVFQLNPVAAAISSP